MQRSFYPPKTHPESFSRLGWTLFLLLGAMLFVSLSLLFAQEKTEKIEGSSETKPSGEASRSESQPPHNWHSNVEVARKVIKKFEKLQSYTASFRIHIKEGSRTRKMSGKLYYQKPGKLRYEFDQPRGNLIVSDGRIMWFYIQRLNTAGKQELDLKKKQPSGRSVFRDNPLGGLERLFRKYHYRFDRAEQPRQEAGGNFFIFDMEQREKIGGYERIKLYVDAKDHLVRKAVGDDGYGKVSTIEFSQIKLNPSLEGSLFQYKPDNKVSVVQNPLVSE